MGEINRRYFESLMDRKRLSLRALAGLMGMNHSQLSLTFSGTRRMSIEDAAQLSNIFGEPIHRVIEAAGVSIAPTSGRRVTVIGSVNGDGTVSLYGPEIVERTAAPEELPGDCCAIQYRTAGTPLGWADGWIAFCKQHDGLDPTMLGRLCLVKIKGGPEAICTVTRGYKDGTYNLTGPYTKESAALEWSTPILFTRH